MIPQIIFLVMIAIEAIVVIAKHGQQKSGQYNALFHIFSWGLITALIWWGGFFDVMLK